MKIGLIDVDGHHFPNLPLMKLSAWHKLQGDQVEWYEPLSHSIGEPFDRVYLSKVFRFTPDYPYYVNTRELVKGGSGYCIGLEDGKEVYHKERDTRLPGGTEHIYPDYSLYPGLTRDTAYGFLSRGCPRGCRFCHVKAKEGGRAYKTADLSEFWRGQKNVVLLDPNITACAECKPLFQQLIDSRSRIDFSQGLDIRMLDEEKVEMLTKMNIANIHFAWDQIQDREVVLPKFKMVKDVTGYAYQNLTVYILTNFDTTTQDDLERVYTLRDLGFNPYVMVYNKADFVRCDKNGKPVGMKAEKELRKKYTQEQIRHFEVCWKIQRWVNNRVIFRSCPRFEDFYRGECH